MMNIICLLKNKHDVLFNISKVNILLYHEFFKQFNLQCLESLVDIIKVFASRLSLNCPLF